MVRLKRRSERYAVCRFVRLNSTMVRLKPSLAGGSIPGTEMSQFHYGSIKTKKK